MQFGFVLTDHCNARCLHCSTHCAPERREELSTERVCDLMDQAAAIAGDEPLRFLLSGGEPFLDFKRLLSIVRHGHGLGAKVTCVTNASWASSEAKARERLNAIQAAGLWRMAISSSRFHETFVKRSRVERALRIAREIGLGCTLKYVRTGTGSRSPEAVRAWALAAVACEVQDFALMPYLREGATLPEHEYAAPAAGLPAGRCPAPLVNIRETGKVYACCTPGADRPLLELGDVRASRLNDLHDRFYLAGVTQILREHGPIAFAHAVQARGLGRRLNAGYTDVCALCTHIANDPAMAAVAGEAATALEVRQLQEILGLADSPQAASTAGAEFTPTP